MHIFQGGLQEERRGSIHHQRALILQPCACIERRRGRRRGGCIDQGLRPQRLAGNVSELGPELAEQLETRRPVSLLQGHHQRRQDCGLQQRSAAQLVLRPDLHRWPDQLGARPHKPGLTQWKLINLRQVAKLPKLGFALLT